MVTYRYVNQARINACKYTGGILFQEYKKTDEFKCYRRAYACMKVAMATYDEIGIDYDENRQPYSYGKSYGQAKNLRV